MHTLCAPDITRVKIRKMETVIKREMKLTIEEVIKFWKGTVLQL